MIAFFALDRRPFNSFSPSDPRLVCQTVASLSLGLLPSLSGLFIGFISGLLRALPTTPAAACPIFFNPNPPLTKLPRTPESPGNLFLDAPVASSNLSLAIISAARVSFISNCLVAPCVGIFPTVFSTAQRRYACGLSEFPCILNSGSLYPGVYSDVPFISSGSLSILPLPEYSSPLFTTVLKFSTSLFGTTLRNFEFLESIAPR